MTETERLVAVLKRRLKAAGLTYRDVAVRLGLSEASIKRMFSRHTFTLERLARMCAIAGVSLVELTDEAARSAPQLRSLAMEQERQLVSSPRLLLVAACVLSGWSLEQIHEVYVLTRAEVIRHLVRLDRMGLLTLLPGDRVRLNVARDFEWRPGGPIQRFFRAEEGSDFLASDFSGEGETMAFHFAMIDPHGAVRLRAQMEKLREVIAELHRDGMARPFSERRGICVLMAHRNWEPRMFARLRRPAAPSTPS